MIQGKLEPFQVSNTRMQGRNEAEMQAFNNGLHNIYKWHMRSIYLWIPLALIVVIFSCDWANISGKSAAYTDISTQWETCVVDASVVTIPLNAILTPIFGQITAGIDSAKTNIQTCVITQALTNGSTCYIEGPGFPCLQTLATDCLHSTTPVLNMTIPNADIPAGAFLNALAYTGIQSLIFSAAGLGAVNRALRHTTWLPATIALLIWFVFAIMTYYTVSPIFPVPTQTNGTLLMFLIYGSSKEKYNNLNGGNNHCDLAYNRLWLNLFFILAIFGVAAFNMLLAIYAELAREKAPHKHYEPLKHTMLPCCLAAFTAVFYLIVAGAKASASNNALSSIGHFTPTIEAAGLDRLKVWFPTIWFPFSQPSLDINTVLYVCTFMSIVRGYTIQSISAFRLAFVTSIVYTVSSYPAIVGGFQFYDYNNFHNFDDCYNYFLSPTTTGFFGYPNVGEAQNYCRAFRTSLGASTALFVVMHVIVIACYSTFQENHDRESLVEFTPELSNGINPITTEYEHSTTGHVKPGHPVQGRA